MAYLNCWVLQSDGELATYCVREMNARISDGYSSDESATDAGAIEEIPPHVHSLASVDC